MPTEHQETIRDFKTTFDSYTDNYVVKTFSDKLEFSNKTLTGEECIDSIKCVTFEEDVLFESTIIGFSIKFINCVFKKRVSFKDAEISGSLEFENCTFEKEIQTSGTGITHHKHLDIRGIKLKSNLVLRGSKCYRTLSLTGAHIEGSIKAGPRKRKLNQVENKLEIVKFTDINSDSKSEFESIRMADCKVKGYIDFGGTKIKKSIIACGTHCHGDFILTWRNRYLDQIESIKSKNTIHKKQKCLVTTINVDLNLDNMRIDGDLDCRGSAIKGRVLLSRININGFATFRPWHMLEERETGRLYQSSGGTRNKLKSIQAIQTNIGQLYAQHANVRGGFILTGIKITGRDAEPAIQMTSAEVGSLSLSNYKELNTDLNKSKTKLNLTDADISKLLTQTQITGNIILDYSTINGRLSCNGAKINGKLSLDRITVRGDINLSRWVLDKWKIYYGTEITDDIVVKGATIAGSVFISGLLATKGIDLFAAQIGGSLNGFKSRDLTDYKNMTPATNDQKRESKIGKSTDPYGREFSIRGTTSTIKGNIHLTDYQIDSSILLDSNASIQGSFRLKNCSTCLDKNGKINFENSIVTGDIELENIIALHEDSQPKEDIAQPKEDIAQPKEDIAQPKEDIAQPKEANAEENHQYLYQKLMSFLKYMHSQVQDIFHKIVSFFKNISQIIKNSQDEKEGATEERDYFLNLKLAKIDGDIILNNCTVYNGINCTNAIVRGYLKINTFKVTNESGPNIIRDSIVCDLRAHHANFSTVQISGFNGKGISFDHSTIQQNMLFEVENNVALGHRRNKEEYHLSLLDTKIMGNFIIKSLRHKAHEQST